MSVTFDLPLNVESSLRKQLGDLNRAAKEAALVELYRQGVLAHAHLAQALSLSRDETDALLKKYHVVEDSPSPEAFRTELDFVDRRLRP